jgi:hypothetical protein
MEFIPKAGDFTFPGNAIFYRKGEENGGNFKIQTSKFRENSRFNLQARVERSNCLRRG